MTRGGQLRKTPERFLRPDHPRLDNPAGYPHSHTDGCCYFASHNTTTNQTQRLRTERSCSNCPSPAMAKGGHF